MKGSDRTVLIALAAMAAAWIATAAAGRPSAPIVPAASATAPGGGGIAERPIDLNAATWEEITLLPGIGETRARRIIAYRERAGAFRSLDELRQISGIGDALIQRIRDRVIVRRPGPGSER